MTRFFNIFLLVALSSFAFGQNEPKEIPLKAFPEYRFNVSYAEGLSASVRNLEIGLNTELLKFKQDNLIFGMGVRAGIQDYNKVTFTTAHANIKSQENDRDSLYFNRVQSMALNLSANVEYKLIPKLWVGGSLDLLGISLGLDSDAEFRPGVTSQQLGYFSESITDAHPTSANAFSFGNAKGCLNSQVYVRVEFSRKVNLRAGLAYLYQEFSTEDGYGAYSAYRYQNNNLAFFAGLTFNRFNEK